jgi:hypothetical protein
VDEVKCYRSGALVLEALIEGSGRGGDPARPRVEVGIDVEVDVRVEVEVGPRAHLPDTPSPNRRASPPTYGTTTSPSIALCPFLNVMFPSGPSSTSTWSPALNSPWSSFIASGSWIIRWIARFSGRAP